MHSLASLTIVGACVAGMQAHAQRPVQPQHHETMSEADFREKYPSGEVVITPAGDVAEPWVEWETCRDTDDEGACRNLLLNSVTREVARLDGKWSSMFEPTGNGQEVRRIENATDKAIRLGGETP